MLSAFLSDPIFHSRQIRLETLVRLRWLAILGQTLAILIVWFGLGYSFLAVPCLILIALSVWLNLYLQFQFSKSVRLAPLPATGLLAYDSAQLGGLLYLTGGLQNPFALLLLVPAVVSATTQPARYTLFLASLITVIATLLVFFHQPLPWAHETPPTFPVLYMVGIWTAVILTMLFLSVYAFRLAQEGHLLANALSATELVLANEQHLSNLDGLATAAAHELGTPLATIQLVAKELERDLHDDDPIREDILLLRSQAERCREILGTLRSLSGDAHNNFTKMRLTALIGEVVEPFERFGVNIKQIFPDDLADQPVLMRNPGMLYGLGNLIENAVDFATAQVRITSQWNDTMISVQIADDGPGFSDTILPRLGDPYVTTRDARGPSSKEGGTSKEAGIGSGLRAIQADGHHAGGLGLGVFIAKTLLERSGATVKIANKQTKDSKNTPQDPFDTHGAVIDITWRRVSIEANQAKQ